ncbi:MULTISPECIES: ABC transporter permease [unclassified Streptomyces]|uniref:ABC transporter permease n=1 Tax=unclassified Streptomyces TaxID=2593676 RepID=UPI0036E71B2F
MTATLSLATGPGRSRGRVAGAVRWARRHPAQAVAAGVLLLWLIVIVLAPLLAPYDPLDQGSAPLEGASSAHWLGTDPAGRDVLSRVLYGARLSVPVGLLLVTAAAVIGTAVGLVAGFFGGWVDDVLMRFTDVVFAFPVIILAMAVAASLGPSLPNAVIAGALVWWPGYARTVRSTVLSLRESDFVHANRLAGVGSIRSILVDLLPGVAGSLLVLAMLDVGGAILLLSGLSFLGLGARPPAAEWGSMISEASQYFNQWWLAVVPGLSIVTVVVAFNVLGDALRDRLDPKLSTAGELS